jgi:hypothetical protein
MTTNKKKNTPAQFLATALMIVLMLAVAGLYVVGCIQQARGKYRDKQDTRDHVKGQVQPVPHEISK